MARKDEDAVEGLKNRIYSRKDPPHIDIEERTPLSPSEAEAPVGWSDIKTTPNPPPPAALRATWMEKPRRSLAAQFFIASTLFFCVAGAIAIYTFYFGGNTISPQNIDLQVVAPSLIDGGKETQLQVIINNHNSAELQLVDLVINYPDGTRDPADPTKALAHERQSIGTIAAGQQLKQTANAIFYGQEGAQQKVTVTLEYSVANSNAVFQKQAEADFVVGSSPVSVQVSAPSEAIAGQQFALDLTVQSNSATAINDVVLQGQYPFGFSVVSASPSADAGGTIWRLGTLAPGASQSIHLVGTIDGQDGDQRVFRFLAGQDPDQTDTQIKVPFVSVPQTLVVRRPFISGSILVNGQNGKTVAVAPGGQVVGTIQWQNNLTDPVSNVEVVLTLAGPMLDRNSINSTSGFYQSTNNTITWTKDQVPELATIAPGGSGTLPFSFSVLAPGSGGVVYTNPTIDLSLTVSGVRPGQDNVPEKVTSAASTQVTLSSLLSLGAQALHFVGPFTNSGPMPPVAEQSTTYTIVWTATNSSNTIANATAVATLPPYVQFLNAQAGSGISYDSASRSVTWNIGDLKAGSGYSLPSRTAAFQVILLPSLSQVGSAPPLTGAVLLSGQDRFAQVGVQASAAAPTTALTGDSGFQSSMGQVVSK